jgi:hypothetical protein
MWKGRRNQPPTKYGRAHSTNPERHQDENLKTRRQKQLESEGSEDQPKGRRATMDAHDWM